MWLRVQDVEITASDNQGAWLLVLKKNNSSKLNKGRQCDG